MSYLSKTACHLKLSICLWAYYYSDSIQVNWRTKLLLHQPHAFPQGAKLYLEMEFSSTGNTLQFYDTDTNSNGTPSRKARGCKDQPALKTWHCPQPQVLKAQIKGSDNRMTKAHRSRLEALLRNCTSCFISTMTLNGESHASPAMQWTAGPGKAQPVQQQHREGDAGWGPVLEAPLISYSIQNEGWIRTRLSFKFYLLTTRRKLNDFSNWRTMDIRSLKHASPTGPAPIETDIMNCWVYVKLCQGLLKTKTNACDNRFKRFTWLILRWRNPG